MFHLRNGDAHENNQTSIMQLNDVKRLPGAIRLQVIRIKKNYKKIFDLTKPTINYFVYISGSDSEDNSDLNGPARVRPSKSCQYNFLVQLGKYSLL